MAINASRHSPGMKDDSPQSDHDSLNNNNNNNNNAHRPSDKEENPDISENFLLGIYLVKSGSKGDSLLFRYPFSVDGDEIAVTKKKKESNNVFALTEDPNRQSTEGPSSGNASRTPKSFASLCTELDFVASNTTSSNKRDQSLYTVVTLPDRVVSNLFAVKSDLCGQKLEIKINNVRFVGHPIILSSEAQAQANSQSSNDPKLTSCEYRSKDIRAFNVVFALRANASHEVVNSFHKCSKLIAQALDREEKAKGYLSKEAKSMLTCHDEASSPSEECETSPYSVILQRSQLAQDLRKIFHDLKTLGKTHLKIDGSSDLNLCIQQTVHRLSLRAHRPIPSIGHRELQKCLSSLRSYHAILLLDNPKTILQSITGNEKNIRKVVHAASPTKYLIQIAIETGLDQRSVFDIVIQLVFWAKATIIYPLSETNVYVINPLASTSVDNVLIGQFASNFPNANLLKFMSEFSLGASIDQLRNPLHNQQQQIQLVNMVTWLLRHRLITQLHTYVYLLPPNSTSPCLGRKSQPSSLHDSQHGDHNGMNENSPSYNDPSKSPITSGMGTNPKDIYRSSSNPGHVSNSLSYERSMNVLRELGLGDFERESIYQVPAAKNAQDLTFFAKLCQYFDGKHHLEDIIHRENVKRSDILAIIDKFRDVLITCQHEDKAVFQLCPYLCE